MAKKDNSFNEQAYLMWDHYIQKRSGAAKKLSRLSTKSEKTGLSFHKVTGNYQPGDFISKVMSDGNKFRRYQHLLDLESHKLSSLLPEVKLFRVSGNKYIPFYFPEGTERTTMGTILQPGSSLGAVGIKSFDASFVGKDFFTRDKLIECSLSLYTDSMENIFKDPPAGFAQLSELFTISSGQNGLKTQIREGFSKEVSTDSINRPFSHEIGAVLGYAVPSEDGVFSSEERQAIQNTSLLLRLTYTGHNINVSQDGQTTIDITYVGRMDGSLNNSAYNILADSADLLNLTKIQSDINFFKGASSLSDAQRKEKIQKLESTIRKTIRNKLSQITHILEDSKKVYYTVVSPKSIREFKNFTNQITETKEDNPPKESAEAAKPSTKSGAPDKKLTGNSKIPHNSTSIQYFYLGDFMEAVLQMYIIETKKALKKSETESSTSEEKRKTQKQLTKFLENLRSYRILFGNTPIYTGRDQVTIANLSDIPVSAKLAAQILFEDLIQTQTLKFTVSNFVDKVVGKLLPSCLNDHLYKDAANLHDPINIRSSTVSGADIKSLSSEVKIEQLKGLLNRKNINRTFSDDKEYYFIYSEMTTKEVVARNGNREEDLKSGVYHFSLSKDRGMVKSIDFSQATVQFRKEALMLESVSLFDELKMPYNVSISMYGNCLFFPGSMIYVNPSSIGFGDPRNARSAAARLGIGGYYIVVSVKTNFNQGMMSTTLDARHQDWASDGNAISTLQEMEQLGITAEARRNVAANKNPFRAEIG